METTQNKIQKLALSILMLVAISLPASAAIVSIDNGLIQYTYDDSSLFGTAILDGNDLVFNDIDYFAALSVNGMGADLVSETLDIKITLLSDDLTVPQLYISEQGDYVLRGGTTTGANLQTRINGGDIMNDTFTGDTTTGGDNGLPPENWSLSTLHNVNLDGEGSMLTLTIEDILTAISGEDGDIAFIEKKSPLRISVVPVPAAVWLFGSVLATLGLFRKRAEATA